jgi:hypothetical protein
MKQKSQTRQDRRGANSAEALRLTCDIYLYKYIYFSTSGRSEISFGLFSPSEMQRLSEIQVVSHLLFQLPKREPMPYGPLDPRMVRCPLSLTGHAPLVHRARTRLINLHTRVCACLRHQGVCNTKGICSTCGQKVQECAGHFGYIKLALPGMHVHRLFAVGNVDATARAHH